MIRGLKQRCPGVHLKAFTMVEVHYFSRIAKISIEETLLRMKQAGVDSCPGGGAEIFHPRVRRIICDHKVSGQVWLNTAKKAHESAVTEKTYSLAEGIRAWWSKRHVEVCDKLFDKALQASDVALFGTVLGLCGLAGVEPNFTVAISGTWFGGKGVADVIKATLMPAAHSKAPAPRSKKGRR